jgi:DNA mismatch repair protein MutL
MILEGARELAFEEVGAPEGTTFIMRNLFFNTPARRKFLKSAATEGGYIADLMEHLALSRPDISFKLLMGNQMKFHTSGNNDLREVIYRIYGRDVAGALVPIQSEQDGVRIEGYLGKPVQVRSNRSFEICFINGRFIRSAVVSRAVEEGYKEYLMQHKFPVCVLHITMDPQSVDVNVHPTKMDVRFSNSAVFSAYLCGSVKYTLKHNEMIPEALLESERERKQALKEEQRELEQNKSPEPFEQKRTEAYRVTEAVKYESVHPKVQEFRQNPVWERVKGAESREELSEKSPQMTAKPAPEQLNLFEEKILTEENRKKFRIIGQVFETYWLIEFEDKLMMIDQHAAHEKVNYERLMKQYREKNVISQRLMPPVIISLSSQEENVLLENMEVFLSLGYEIEAFGGSEYALRSVPVDLYGCNEEEMFVEVLDQLADGGNFGSIRVIEEKIASMSCKAAVKGNNALSFAEAEALIDELLTLENPYNCPHGRPTIVTMTKSEMDRKFKRIVG